MRRLSVRLLASMSEFTSTHGVLAVPPTRDPLFRRIEEVHAQHAKPYGRILDAGTGGHSLKWLATLPKGAVETITAVTADLSAGEGEGPRRGCLGARRGEAALLPRRASVKAGIFRHVQERGICFLGARRGIADGVRRVQERGI